VDSNFPFRARETDVLRLDPAVALGSLGLLTLYHTRAGGGERPADLAEGSLPANVAWIDLLRPDPDEIVFVKRNTGLDVPSIEILSEIESSRDRLRSGSGDLPDERPQVRRSGSVALRPRASLATCWTPDYRSRSQREKASGRKNSP
jgi:hypothetical protein